VKPHEPIRIEEVRAAQSRIAGVAVRTPLVRLNVEDAPARIYLKLENLQPVGSFKLRGVFNTVSLASKEQLSQGLWTVSPGNTGQAVAWCAKHLGVPCTVVVPERAPESKLAAIARLGGEVVKTSFAELMQVAQTHRLEGMEGFFVHPFSNPTVMAGNGTIGLEILEDLPEVETIITPYGGGGLSCGIASTLRSLKPEVKLFASEVETGAPFAASLAAGEPTEVEHTPSLVDGISSPRVFPEMFPLASRLLDGSLVTSLEEVTSALRIVAERNHVIAEGAGAAPVAAALSGQAGGGNVVCVVSGGNVDSDKLAGILGGQTP